MIGETIKPDEVAVLVVAHAMTGPTTEDFKPIAQLPTVLVPAAAVAGDSENGFIRVGLVPPRQSATEYGKPVVSLG